MSKKLHKIQINGKDIEEGVIMNGWFDSRFNANANILLCILGRTGSGKSWSCIRICEDWYKYKFGEEFPIAHVCFSIREAMELIVGGKLRKGEIIILEEAGVLMNALDFQNKLNKFFGYVLQSFRSKNIGIIFNLPNFALLSKTARSLLHGVFETESIDKKNKKVVLKPFYLQTNVMMGKAYTKFLVQRIGRGVVKVKRISCSMPSEKNILDYEKKKEEFVNRTAESLLNEMKKKDGDDKVVDKNKPRELWVAIKKIFDSGITKHEEIANILGVRRGAITKNLAIMEEKGLINHNYLKKADFSLENGVFRDSRLVQVSC